jgi:hypothetical protein
MRRIEFILLLSKAYVPSLDVFQEGDGQTSATRLLKKVYLEVTQSLPDT